MNDSPSTKNPRTTLRMPRTSRELLQLLSLTESVAGLSAQLGRVDLTRTTASHIHDVVHRCRPGWSKTKPVEDTAGLRTLLGTAVLSEEFQAKLISHLLEGFPELGREIFIQIPHAAGPDIVSAAALTRLTLAQKLEDPEATPKDMLFSALAAFVRTAAHVDTVFVHGSMTLADCVIRFGLRPQDRAFTILPSPVGRLVNAANEAVNVLLSDPAGTRQGTRTLLHWLGLDRLPADASAEQLTDLALRALKNPQICRPNEICRSLSDDAHASYESALTGIARYDVELTTMSSCRAWSTTRWGAHGAMPALARHHVSEAQALADCGAVLEAATEEDTKLYDLVVSDLAQTGDNQSAGRDLARRARSRPMATASMPAAINSSQDSQACPTMMVAKGDQAVEHYIQHLPEPRSDLQLTDSPEAGMHVVFGASGNAGTITVDGWSVPEHGYIWTVGHHSTLRLPRPVPGAYRLQFQVAPFVDKTRLSFQRLDLTVNGTHVLSLRIAEQVVFAVELPWHVLASADAVELSFDLPDAARPIDIQSRNDDDRVLGLSFRRLLLTPVGAVEPAGLPLPALASPQLTPAELMLRFESIGQNCEFGLAQRRCGAEPLGLLRFTSTPLPKLLAALRARFEGMGARDNVIVALSSNGNEYIVEDRAFGFTYHAWVNYGELTEAEVHARETRRVPFLKRKLIEDLTAGEKIFVYHGMDPLSLDDARALAAAIRAYGPSTLMWVEVADQHHPAGTVEWIEAGLIRASIDRFAPGEDAHDFSTDSWIELCSQALALVERV